MIYTTVYLCSVIAANLLVARFGAPITPLVAFVFIGLDITTRDKLHDSWHNRHLWLRMAALILSGSALSFLLNRAALQIAIASFVAFAVSGAIDAVVYQALRKATPFERVNWSNLVSGAVDSLLFPALAFGWPPSMEIVYGQATAKIAGGLFWSLVMARFNSERILEDFPVDNELKNSRGFAMKLISSSLAVPISKTEREQ